MTDLVEVLVDGKAVVEVTETPVAVVESVDAGPAGPNGIAGYTFQMQNPTPGDLVMFDGSYWVNEPKHNIFDGGNF